jgi:hypothetical protein
LLLMTPSPTWSLGRTAQQHGAIWDGFRCRSVWFWHSATPGGDAVSNCESGGRRSIIIPNEVGSQYRSCRHGSGSKVSRDAQRRT